MIFTNPKLEDKNLHLVLGTCRIMPVMKFSKLNCIHTWTYKDNYKDKHYNLGRTYSINEAYEMLLLILGDKNESEYIGHEYSFDEIKENIKYIRRMFNKLDGIIIEVSSLKYCKKNNTVVHNRRDSTVNSSLTKNDMENYLKKIVNLVPEKKIIFINHFLHFRIDNRLIINKYLKDYENNYENILVITPSELWDNNFSIGISKKFLSDENHYIKISEVLNKVCIFIDDKIINYYKLKVF